MGDEYDRVAATVYPLVDADKLNEAKQQILIPRVARLNEANIRLHKILAAPLSANLQEAEKAKQFETMAILWGTLLSIWLVGMALNLSSKSKIIRHFICFRSLSCHTAMPKTIVFRVWKLGQTITSPKAASMTTH